MKNFADRLIDKLDDFERSPVMPGIDPRIETIPTSIRQEAMSIFDLKELDLKNNMSKYGVKNVEREIRRRKFQAVGYAFFDFGKRLVNVLSPEVGIFKLQYACYSKYGSPGIEALEELVDYIKSKGRLVVIDSKSNDIGDTSQLYADGFLGAVELCDGSFISSTDVDAITVNPYEGVDNIAPFRDTCSNFGKGIFVLAKTSNPSSGQLQDLKLDKRHYGKLDEKRGGRTVYEQVTLLTEIWGRKVLGSSNYSSVGLVVGDITAGVSYPVHLDRIRKIYPNCFKLQPGYGVQGLSGRDVTYGFNGDGYGSIINNSRGLTNAYLYPPYKERFTEEEFEKAAFEAALDMKKDIINNLKEAGKWQ